MKTVDLLRLAVKNLKDVWTVLPAVGMAAGVFCLCFAGAVWQAVGQEQARPYELAVSASGSSGLTDATMAKISELPNVTAATPLLSVSATVRTGVYTARLTLTGIDPSYLNSSYSKGGVFAQNSAMPCLVLNAAAGRQFSKNANPSVQGNRSTGTSVGGMTGKGSTGAGTLTGVSGNAASTASGADSGSGSGAAVQPGGSNTAGTGSSVGTAPSSQSSVQTGTGTVVQNGTTDYGIDTDATADSAAGSSDGSNTDAPKIDWLNASFTLQASGSGQWIPAKVSGMIAGNAQGQQPAAYISLSTAKNLLYKSGQSTGCTGAKVRVTNSGYADSVSRAISVLGLQVTNPNTTLQAKWDGESKEMTYLIVLGAFSLLCSAVLIAARRKILLLEQQKAWELLRWLGIREKYIHAVFLFQAVIVSFIGSTVGIVVTLTLPSFLPSDLREVSIYTLSIPLNVGGVTIVLSTVAAVVPCFAWRRRRDR